MLFARNQSYTSQTLLDKANVEEVIQFERFCRDHSLWDSMAQCFAKDSLINISWFKGTGAEFVESSRQMNRYAPHKIHSTQTWVNDTRAVALMQATIQMRIDVEGTMMDLNSDAQLVYCLEKSEDGTWYITRLECIYEKDSLTPVLPSNVTIDDQEITSYRSSYACLSYVLKLMGYEPNHELQGIDRPDEVKAYYQEIDQWLTFKN